MYIYGITLKSPYDKTFLVLNITTNILCSVTLLFNRAVYEVRWETLQRGAGHGRQYNAAVGCWISKATSHDHNRGLATPIDWSGLRCGHVTSQHCNIAAENDCKIK